MAGSPLSGRLNAIHFFVESMQGTPGPWERRWATASVGIVTQVTCILHSLIYCMRISMLCHDAVPEGYKPTFFLLTPCQSRSP